MISDYKKSITPLTEFSPETHRPSYKPNKPVPAVKVRPELQYLKIEQFNSIFSNIVCTCT